MKNLIVNTVQILGINIVSTTKPRLLLLLEGGLAQKSKIFITTPNPEIILEAQNNPTLKEAINNSDFAIPDGAGLRLADNNLEIIKGRELMLDLLQIANKKALKVYFLGSTKEVITKTINKVGKDFPNLKAKGNSGPMLNKSANPVSERDISLELDVIKEINLFKPDILFVAFGAPKQEIWVSKNLKDLNIKCAMAVGGALDYYSGSVLPVPGIFSKLNLEWLWRLIQDPKRLPRIFNATVIFPLKLILKGS